MIPKREVAPIQEEVLVADQHPLPDPYPLQSPHQLGFLEPAARPDSLRHLHDQAVPERALELAPDEAPSQLGEGEQQDLLVQSVPREVVVAAVAVRVPEGVLPRPGGGRHAEERPLPAVHLARAPEVRRLVQKRLPLLLSVRRDLTKARRLKTMDPFCKNNTAHQK